MEPQLCMGASRYAEPDEPGRSSLRSPRGFVPPCRSGYGIRSLICALPHDDPFRHESQENPSSGRLGRFVRIDVVDHEVTRLVHASARPQSIQVLLDLPRAVAGQGRHSDFVAVAEWDR